MAEAEDISDLPGDPRRGLARWRWRISLGLLALLLLVFAIAWFSRERLADDYIAGELDRLGLPATYEIERIGPDRQVLRNVVVGDPERPDLTIDRVTVALRYRFGLPTIGPVTLERARLFGSFRKGQLSFGSLDPVLFAESAEPPGLPDIDLALIDGRALIETGYGPVGLKAEGSGGLAGGFRGIVAANAPELAIGDCTIDRATLYGDIGVTDGKPRFAGPIRMNSLGCPQSGLALADAALQAEVDVAEDLASIDGSAGLATGRASFANASLSGLSGKFRAALGDNGVNATFDMAATELTSEQAKVARLAFDGSLRARDGFERVELQADVEGRGIALPAGLDAALAEQLRATPEGIPGALLARIRDVLRRETPGSLLTASVTVRKTGSVLSAVVPQAQLRGGSGASLVALSRGQFSNAGQGAPRIEGNISTGGGLPVITGRMEQAASGASAFRLRMAEYVAGDARLAIPELVVLQGRTGAVGFSGRVEASGGFPGGAAQGLVLPLRGNWSSARGLALWPGCTDVRFERLAFSSLVLRRRNLSLCPPPGRAMLTYTDGALRFAAGAPALTLDGELAGTPMTLRSGPVGVAWPGVATIRSATLVLGPPGTAATFELANLDARLGSDIGGSFAGTNARLDVVPFDIGDAAGEWRYLDGVLSLAGGSFTLTDRADTARFEPLVARDAALTLEDSVIRADAGLLHPESGRLVTRVAILHDLGSGTGHADLAVPGLRFDRRLQPDELSYLAEGVIALAEGTVTGEGRIDWNDNGITSSGAFSTRDFDFAAAFGPVKGLRGTINFSDLLALTTPPGQVLYIDSVNPGIEATDGVVTYRLTDGAVLDIANARLPFLGGFLDMHPVRLDFSRPQERRYVFEMIGVDAAQFVQRMELENISATGIFDGTLPLVFDELGNGTIDNGMLISRPPGGNVSYVGELTYEDMGAMANFAFAALRSLDYRQMLVEMHGPLTGEIITSVRFDGVTQGAGASRNFITRRVAQLPIRFNVNIRSSFYKLFRDLQSIYDPAMSQDPAALGLVDEDGNPIIPRLQPDRTIQTPESEVRP